MQENADGTYKIPDSIKVDLGIGQLRTGKLLFCGRSITLTQAIIVVSSVCLIAKAAFIELDIYGEVSLKLRWTMK